MLNITYQQKSYALAPQDNVKLKNEGTYGNGSIDWSPEGLILSDIAAQIGVVQPVGARIDGQYYGLDKFIAHDCQIDFITAQEEEGKAIINRTGIFLLNFALAQTLGGAYLRLASGVTDDGRLYVDFDLTTDDVIDAKIQAAMQAKLDSVVQNPVYIKAKKLPYFQTIERLKTAKATYLLHQLETMDDDCNPISVYMLHDYLDLDTGLLLSDTKSIRQFSRLSVEKRPSGYRIAAEMIMS